MMTKGKVMAKVIHYASLMQGETEVFGTAELIVGGYLFRSDDNPRKAIAIDYRNADLMLFGLKPMADDQWKRDTSSGDLARLLGRVA
jgi:hypothetical protein